MEPTAKQKEEAREIVNSVVVGIQTGSGYVAPDAEITNYTHLPTLTKRIATALSSRDTEIREVLEGLSRVLKFKNGADQRCWCNNNWTHSPACLATQTLWNKVRE